MLTARSQGAQVEDLSQRTEFSQTWAQPNGTWKTESHTGRQRFRNAKGGWTQIDLGLTQSPGGGVAPKAHVDGLQFPGAGSNRSISLSHGAGRTVSIGVPGQLPTPTIDGETATYPNVAPGVDMVLQALRDGFDQSWVIRDRSDIPAGGLSWTLPLKLKGLTPRSEKDGSVSFLDSKNNVASRIPAALAWDARVGTDQEVDSSHSAVSLQVVQKSGGQGSLVVTPDAAWLADPATVFPVTVDPSYTNTTLNPTFDAYIQQGVTTDLSTQTVLKIGSAATNQNTRTYLNFNLGSLKGDTIIASSLKLLETSSGTSSPNQWDGWYMTGTASSSSNWSNQTFWGSAVASSTDNGTTQAWRAMDVTNLIQQAVNDGYSPNTIGLRAHTETGTSSVKNFASMETTNDPYLIVTYDRIPAAPSSVTVISPMAGSYSANPTPTVGAAVSDPDGNTVQADIQVHNSTAFNSSSLVAECTTGYVSSGNTATCTSPSLPDGHYYLRAKAYDSMQWGPWAAGNDFYVAAMTPNAPVISCPGYANNSWAASAPSSNVSCTISAAGSGTSAPTAISYAVDGNLNATVVGITASSDPNVAKTMVSVPKTAGEHELDAKAISPSGIYSSQTHTQFGYGTVAMSSPVMAPVTQTTSSVNVAAAGPPALANTSVSAVLKWRLPSGNDGYTGWNTAQTLQLTNNGSAGISTNPAAWNTLSATVDSANGGIPLNARVATTLELEVCVTYSTGTQCSWDNQQIRVIRVPNAFGAGFPTTQAGPGQVALWTGEFATNATDVTVPGYTGTLSLSRTNSTFAGPANTSASVFGPGWTASLDGPQDGFAGDQLVDNTRTDGTLLLVDGQGTSMVFRPAPNAGSFTRRTGTDLTQGSWIGVDPTAAASGITMNVNGTGTATTVTVNEPDGTATDFSATTAPGSGSNGAAVFAPVDVAQPGNDVTTYHWNSSGRVERILASIPTGLTSADCPLTDPAQTINNSDSSAPKAGCRSIYLTYGAAPLASGDYIGQVKAAYLQIYNPNKAGGAGMDNILIATYKYDTSGYLVSETDARTNLTTTYTYDTSHRLSTLTPPGQAAYTINYGTVTGAQVPRFQNITRPNPAAAGGGTAYLTSVVYNVPTSGTGLPDLSAGTVANWGQTAAPTGAAAVFGQDHQVNSVNASDIGSAEWQYATIQATDANGYTVNTADYGAGDWQRSATNYDPNTHQVVKAYAPVDIDQVLNHQASSDAVGTITVYNTSSNGPANTPAGSVVTDTYGTTRPMLLANGTTVQARPHSHMTYDEGSPNGGINPNTNSGWGRVTTATTSVSAALISNGDLSAEPTHAIKTGYGTSSTSWTLGEPTSTTRVVDGGSGDITRTTGYNSEGRVIAQSQPMSNGHDAGTRDVVYYSVGANASFPQCGSTPQWAGTVCMIYYADQANGHDLITTAYSGYDAYLSAATLKETANAATRTTSTGFDNAGRTLTTQTTATGLTGSTPINGVKYHYDGSTGLQDTQWALDASGSQTGDPITTGYDSWGRATTYSASSTETTTTTYNSAGQVATVTDPTGTKTYGYGNDANGQVERRGMPTSIAISGGPNGDLTFTGAYDRAGNLILQTLPGSLKQRVSYDTSGQETGLTYSGQVTTLDSNNNPVVNPDSPWLGWSLVRDSQGRIVRENTPSGGAFATHGTDPNATVAAAPYDRTYTYDAANRLTKVQDLTAAAGAGVDPNTGEPVGAGCVTRNYSFDKNGNRLSLATSPAASDGTCQTANGTTTKSSGWDAGDRTTNTSYAFDALGRQTTLPAADAPQSGSGDISLGYYDTDSIASIAQGGTTTTWTLDQAQRRSLETATTGSAVTTTARHYTDAGDNPGYVDVTAGGATTRTRYGTSIGGDLGVSISNSGATTAQVTLDDPHSDVVATVNVVATSTPATGIAGWSNQDEFGNPETVSSAPLTPGVGYGWVGAKQRATTGTGLILMGARVYDPTVGAFTSTDPVYGGNSTTYGYPLDPVNGYDLTGQCWSGFGAVCAVGNAINNYVIQPVSHGLVMFGQWVEDNADTLSMVAGGIALIPGLEEFGALAAGLGALQAYRDRHDTTALALDLASLGFSGAGMRAAQRAAEFAESAAKATGRAKILLQQAARHDLALALRRNLQGYGAGAAGYVNAHG